MSTLITWGCPSTTQYPSLLRRRVTVPRLLGGARSYAKLIINGAKGPPQELNDFFRKEAHHLKKHFPARVEEDSPGVFAAFFRNESELRLFTSDFPSGQYSWKGEPLTFKGGAKRGSNNSPPQVSARNTKKPKYAPAASAPAPAVGSGTPVQWVWISHQAAQGRTLVEVCSLFGRPLKTAAGARIIGKGAAAASPAPGTFVCFGSKRAALRLIQCSCKRSLLSVPDTDEPLVELSVVPPAPHTFLSLKSATPESEVLTISGDGWRNLDSSYIRSFFLPEDDRCSVSRTATGYSVAFPSLSSLQQFFKAEVVPLSSEVFQWQFNQVVLTVGFKGSALDITLGHRMPASGRRPVVSQWFPPRYGGVNLKGFVYPELRLPAWRGEFPVYMIREATIEAIGSVTQYLGSGQPRNATVLVPVSMSATLVRLLSESLYGIQITPEIFAPLCVKTLPTPRKGDAELGKFRILYLSVIPAPPYSLLRVENSYTGSWGCPRLDAAGNYSRWLCSAIADLAQKWVGIFPVRSSLSTWTGASPLWTMLGNWVGPTQTRTLISNTWHAGLTNGTILFASEAGQAQLWKQLSSDWGKKFQVQLIHVKDGVRCYEVATPAMGFTFPSYYEISAMQTVELQVLDHTLKFGAPGRLGLAIIAHSLSLIGIDCRSSDVALYAKEGAEVSSLREFFLKDSSQDSDDELAAASMAESLTSWPDQSTLEEDLFACSTPLIRPRAVKGDLESFATWAGCQLHPALRASGESPSPVEVMSAPSFSELSEGSPTTGEAKVTPPTGNSRVISHIFRPSDSTASGPPDSSGVGLSPSTPKSSAVEPVAAINKSVYPSPLFSVTFHDSWASKVVNAARMKALTALPLDSLSCEFIFQDPILSMVRYLLGSRDTPLPFWRNSRLLVDVISPLRQWTDSKHSLQRLWICCLMGNFSHYRRVRDGHILTALLYAALEFVGAPHSNIDDRVEAYCSMLHSLGVNPRPSDEMLSVGLLQLFNSEEGSLLTSQVSDLLAGRRPESVIGEAADLVFTLVQPNEAILLTPQDTLSANSIYILCKGDAARILYRPLPPGHTEDSHSLQGLRLLQEGGLPSRPAYKAGDLFEFEEGNEIVTGRVTKTCGSSVCYEDLSTSEPVIVPNVTALRYPPILGLLALSAALTAPASSDAGVK